MTPQRLWTPGNPQTPRTKLRSAGHTYVPPTLVQTNNAAENTGNTAFPKAFASNVTKNHLILVTIALSGAAPTMSVTDSQGNAYTQIGVTQTGATLPSSLAMFWAIAGSTGACTVTAHNTASAFITLNINEWAGADQSNPIDVFNTAATGLSSTITSGIITPNYPNGVIYVATADASNGSTSRTVGSGYTQDVQYANGSVFTRLATEYKTLAIPGAVTGGWTNETTDSSWTAAIAAIKAA